jgi:hypothetical protein
LAFEHALYPAEQREKYTVLDQDSEQQIPDRIQQNAESNLPATRQEIKHYV